jgi:GGDEF domain-containing protein
MVSWEAGTSPERAHHLVRAADHAMYRAKHAAGDRLVIAGL